MVLQALQEEGLVTIMAEPNLTARSGEPATFLAGGEYPYSTVSDNGTNVQFKNFGIGLNFTPTVVDGNRISLTVGTEVSELDFAQSDDGAGAQDAAGGDHGRPRQRPELRHRRADGELLLAGASRIPALGTMPVIGALFRSQAFKRGQTELVIIVTPVIVNPTSGRRISTPVDNYVPPNDFERILLGRFQGNPRGREAVQNTIGQRRLAGPSGFVFK